MGATLNPKAVVEAFDLYNKRQYKELRIFVRNKQPKRMNVQVRKLTTTCCTISCDDIDTIAFLDKFDDAKVVPIIVPSVNNTVAIANLYYLPKGEIKEEDINANNKQGLKNPIQ